MQLAICILCVLHSPSPPAIAPIGETILQLTSTRNELYYECGRPRARNLLDLNSRALLLSPPFIYIALLASSERGLVNSSPQDTRCSRSGRSSTISWRLEWSFLTSIPRRHYTPLLLKGTLLCLPCSLSRLASSTKTRRPF